MIDAGFEEWLEGQQVDNAPSPGWMRDLATARSIYASLCADQVRQQAQSAQAREIAQLRNANQELRARVDRLERWFQGKSGKTVTMATMTAGIGDALGGVRKVLEERITALEERSAGLTYCGVWSDQVAYPGSSMVTKDGTAWVAMEQVDQLIESEPDQHARAALLRHRGRIVEQMLDKTEIANLKHRNRLLEGRLRPKLVGD